MEVLTAPAVSSAPLSQTQSAPTVTAKSTVPSPSAQLAHAVQAAPPVSAAPQSPAQAGQTATAAHSAPTSAPLVKASVPAPVAINPADPSPREAMLEKEVENLWRDHKQAKSFSRKTSEELKLIRADLARALHSVKNVLARPGCKGEWSSFLDSHSIARTTANRLVGAHEKSIGQPDSNCPDGAIPESTEDVVRRCLDRSWKKLSPVLSTPEVVEMFIGELRNRAQKSFGVDGDAPDSSVWGGAAETP